MGRWDNGQIGTFRGIRGGKQGFGGTAFGTEGIRAIGTFAGYRPLLVEIVKFFRTGTPPVTPEETIAIIAFMEAAEESKHRGGISVTIEEVMAAARASSPEG